MTDKNILKAAKCTSEYTMDVLIAKYFIVNNVSKDDFKRVYNSGKMSIGIWNNIDVAYDNIQNGYYDINKIPDIKFND